MRRSKPSLPPDAGPRRPAEDRRARDVELRVGDVTFHLDHGMLRHSGRDGELALGLPLPHHPVAPLGSMVARLGVDEVLCIARYLIANSERVELVHCSGEWSEPIRRLPSFEPRKDLRRANVDPIEPRRAA